MTNLNLPSIESAEVDGKRVFVRCDFDIPLGDGKVTDDTRLLPSISTIEYLIENNATVVAAGHLGRPVGEDLELSLEPVAKWFAYQFGSEIKPTEVGGFKGWEIVEDFIILENLRFSLGEIGKDPEFAMSLADLADVYVNEAFGCSHRKHSSMYGLPQILPHYAGFHLQKEVKILSNILDNPKRPLTIVIGGAKIETKLPLVTKMDGFADHILIGGAIASEYHALGNEHSAQIFVADSNAEKTDITPQSLEKFKEVIRRSGMVVWNGPMGLIEEGHEESSLELARIIAESYAYKIVGGGDTISFLGKHKLLDKFDFASVGGGAMLKFLAGEELPGLIVLQN